MTFIEHCTHDSRIYILFKNLRHIYQDSLVCMLNHETVLNKTERTKVVQGILIDDRRTKLEISNKTVILEYWGN